MVLYTPEGGPASVGTVLTIDFQLDGVDFTVLNGGPLFKFTEAVSFVIDCDTQAEVDYYWDKLLEGGKPDQCGWLKDKFGLSWQVVPKRLRGATRRLQLYLAQIYPNRRQYKKTK